MELIPRCIVATAEANFALKITQKPAQTFCSKLRHLRPKNLLDVYGIIKYVSFEVSTHKFD